MPRQSPMATLLINFWNDALRKDEQKRFYFPCYVLREKMKENRNQHRAKRMPSPITARYQSFSTDIINKFAQEKGASGQK